MQNSPLEFQPSAFSVDTFPSCSSRFQAVEDPNGLHDREVQPVPETIHDQLLVDATSSNSGFAPEIGILSYKGSFSFIYKSIFPILD